MPFKWQNKKTKIFQIIPEELIKAKAHRIWESRRQRKNKNGNPDTDWLEAKSFLIPL